MTTDRADIPWGREWNNASYRGFAGPPPAAAQPMRDPRALGPRRAVTVGAGVLGALALGLGLGFLARPHLASPEPAAPMRAVTPATGALDVEVNAPTAPQAVARPAGKLEVLSPDLASNARRAAQFAIPAAGPAPALAAAPLVPAAPVSPRLPEIARPAAIPAPREIAGGDPTCSGVGGRAAQMVCADPELAAADRELNRAYRRALRSGAAPEQLRQDQRDWLAIREDAARRSPRAVASIYEQRIDELNQIADDGPG